VLRAFRTGVIAQHPTTQTGHACDIRKFGPNVATNSVDMIGVESVEQLVRIHPDAHI
jgi:hypothetical protein